MGWPPGDRRRGWKHRQRLILVAVLTLGAAASCSAGDRGVEVRAATDAVPTTVGESAAGCTDPEGGERRLDSEAAFTESVVGVWLLCSPSSAFGTTDEIGLEIDAGGTWYKLDRAASGALERRDRWLDRGTWDVIDTSSMNGPGHYQLNLKADGGGTFITQPVFAERSPKMRLLNSEHSADYIPADS